MPLLLGHCPLAITAAPQSQQSTNYAGSAVKHGLYPMDRTWLLLASVRERYKHSPFPLARSLCSRPAFPEATGA